MERISKHISYEEAIRSDTAKRLGISNEPNAKQLYRMKLVAERIFESAREYFEVPIYVSSFIRSEALNEALHGAVGSQHMRGEAIDMDCDVFGGITNKELFDYIYNELYFDQLILEDVSEDGTGGWVHCSYKKEGNRNEVLRMTKINGKSIYTNYENIS